MQPSAGKDPYRHAQKLKIQMSELTAHLCDDVRKVTDARAQALFEISAEVLTGLVKAGENRTARAEAPAGREPPP